MAVNGSVPISVPALYVGDLHPDVTDGTLFEHFSSVGGVTSVRICRDSVTGRSLGYGYINYANAQDACVALEKLNHSLLLGKPIRIMWSHRDPDARNSGIGNLFVKNLSDSIDSLKLREIFSKYGTIASCKVVVQDGKSKGHGFIQYDSQESANSAIEKLNGVKIGGKAMYVGHFIKRSERVTQIPEAKYTNLYMKNLDQDITEDLIQLKFSEFGKIVSVKIAKDADGNSKGFGFVNFENPDSAKRATEAMNGLLLGSKALYVARAQKKAERQQILRRQYEEKRNEQILKNMASNVYVKNIDDEVDDDVLRDYFSQCGNISSARIMRDEKGISKGFGFVCFNTPDEANRAVQTLHEERGQASSVADTICSADYTPTGLVPQIPRQGLMYQPYGLRPGWRPSGFIPQARPAFQPMPLPMLPSAPRQQRQNRGRMNGHMVPQPAQSIPFMPHLQQPNHYLNTYKDSNGHQRSGQNKYVPNGLQTINNGSMPSNSQGGTEMLSSMLAAAAPQQQKQMLGERLFPLVQNLKPDLAAKITGMLLEMDNSELLLLLESPESLAAKVDEAIHVLEISKTKASGGGQEALHPNNFFSAEVAVN
ncbi:uncharacterized protein A4U43_C03F19800 [Asparagus officinalis]|uniref:Polyadenylate-binding protein n=1 Tax=Asparagus officinalis TaxID=4686 RepID=A0A5P1FBG4_ASPOF|nr:uncharacterized protein A4U43_C03F19800 [Asparagus officinalis]